MTHIDLVAFDHARDNRPEPFQLEWSELAKLLGTPRETSCTCHKAMAGAPCHEKDGPAWSPARYKNAAPRSNRNVLDVTALVLDFDHVTDDAVQKIGQALDGLQYIVHASHSDRPGERALRAVVALEKPVPREHWDTFRTQAIDALGLAGATNPDPACKDPARLYYFPSRGIGAPFAFEVGDGAPMPVPSAWATPTPVLADAQPTVRGALGPASPALLARAAEHLAGVPPAIEHQGANRHTYVTAACLRHDFALTAEEALPLLAAWNAKNPKPWSREQLSTFLTNAERYAAGRFGWRRELVDNPLPWGNSYSNRNQIVTTVTNGRVSELLEDVPRTERPPVQVYATGFPGLDEKLGGGLWSGRLHAVAAPPGAGKTAWGVQLARNMHATVPVLYVSTELESDEVAARFAAPEMGVAWREIVRGAVRVRDALDGMRIRVIGCDRVPRDSQEALSAVAREAEAMSEEYGQMPVIVLDYMQQLIRGGGEDGIRGRVGDMASQLRAMSQILSTPVLTVLSVSRVYYGLARQDTMRDSDDATVYLAAAKESGDVDYDCAVVLFLDVDHTPSDSSGPKAARLAVAKCRHGDTGFVGCRFDGRTGRWTEDSQALEAIRGTRSGEIPNAKIEEAVKEWLDWVASEARAERFYTANQLTRMRAPDGKLLIPKSAMNALLDVRRDVHLMSMKVQRNEGGVSVPRVVLLPNNWGK